MKPLITLFTLGLCLWTSLAWASPPTQSPTNLLASQPGNSLTALSWSGVPSATSYLVMAQGTGLPSRMVRTTGTSVNLRGLPANTLLTLSVQGRNADGLGPSESTTFTPTPSPVSSAPTNLKVTNVGTSAAIRWTAVPNAITYTVSLQNTTLGGAPVVKTAVLPQAAFTSLTIGHTYTATVQANGADGSATTASTSFAAAALLAPASAPGPVTISNLTGYAATLSWPTVPTASGYQLFVGTNPSTVLNQAPIFTTATIRTLTGLTPGGNYAFAIRAVNQAGRGPVSATNSFLSLSAPAAPSVTVQSGILSLTATWPAVSQADSYTLYWMPGTFSQGSATIVPNVTSPYVLTNLPSGQVHSMAVSATNAVGEGPLSTPQSGTPQALPAPTQLAGTPGDSQVDLSWTASSGAVSYEIGYHQGTVFDANLATIVSATNPAATLTGLTNNQAYMIAVRAVQNSERSVWSAAIQRTPYVPNIRVWRDARDFGNLDTGDVCSFTARQWKYSTVAPPCGSTFTYATANAIVYSTGNSQPQSFTDAATTSFATVLSPGTAHVWWYVWTEPGKTAVMTTRQSSTGTVISTTAGTNGSLQWVHVGSFVFNPQNDDLQFYVGIGNQLNATFLRGVYITQGNETPSSAPTGQGGDDTNLQ